MSGNLLHNEVLGAGRRLVFVHGFTQTGRSWQPIADDLARDHEVVLIDGPGHGDSPAIHAGFAETAAVIGATGRRATYIGYSMGGRLCLRLAVDRPDLVERLVVLGATGGIDDPGERAARVAADEALAQSIEADGVEAFLDRWLAQPMFARLPIDPAGRAERLRNTAAGLAASLRTVGTGQQEPLWADLATVFCPALVMAGEADTKFAALTERLAASLGGPTTTALVPAAGHAAHLEQPEKFLAILRTWLAHWSA